MRRGCRGLARLTADVFTVPRRAASTIGTRMAPPNRIRLQKPRLVEGVITRAVRGRAAASSQTPGIDGSFEPFRHPTTTRRSTPCSLRVLPLLLATTSPPAHKHDRTVIRPPAAHLLKCRPPPPRLRLLSLRTEVTVLPQDIGDTTRGLGGDTSFRTGPAQGGGGAAARLLRCRTTNLSMSVSVSLSRCGRPMRRGGR